MLIATRCFFGVFRNAGDVVENPLEKAVRDVHAIVLAVPFMLL